MVPISAKKNQNLDQLIDMIQEVGNYMGWWNPDSPNFRFTESPYHKDVVWMFACCYYA